MSIKKITFELAEIKKKHLINGLIKQNAPFRSKELMRMLLLNRTQAALKYVAGRRPPFLICRVFQIVCHERN